MSQLLEILGRGLLSELAAAFRTLLCDTNSRTTTELESAAASNDAGHEDRRLLAVRLLHEHAYPRATKLFRALLDDNAEDHTARIGLACALDAGGQTRRALSVLSEALRYHSAEPPLWFALGFCHEKLGEIDNAIQAYERTLDLTPQLRNAHERLAAIYLSRDEPCPALAHYEHMSWCEPTDLGVLLALGNLYLRVGRPEDAVRPFENAICLDPDNWEARDDLVDSYVHAGRIEEAIQMLERLIDERPECADQHLRLGDLLARAGDERRALASYEEAAALNPDCLEAAVKLGTMHLTRGAYDDAALTFSRAIEINDRLVDAYIGLGVAQQTAGATNEAMVSFETASQIEPNGSLLFSEMAKLQLRVLGSEHRRQHLASHDGSPAAGGYGDPLDELVEEQIDNIERTIAKRPTHADLHYRLGVLLRHTGRLDDAIRAFSKAVSINPQYSKALVKLGLTLRESGQSKAAVRAFERALDVDQESVDLHYQLGLIFADEGDFASAVDHFECATRHAPEQRDYLANLALSLQNMGLLDRATATWQILGELTPDDEIPVALRRQRHDAS